MTSTHPLIEIHLRLIGALQKGYIEALEAGDWQAADYRCSHLNKLTEGLYYLSQSLEQGNHTPLPVPQRSNPSWLNGVRTINPIPSSTNSPTNPPTNPPKATEESTASPAIVSEPSNYEWGVGYQGAEPPPIDEVWK
ncbi:MAG: hypothetical protein F6J86_37150 [Symploca sp. SIO1B1]|nr:hypothetical protein [Symploca sp. SIO2D2]NER19982.1 hypothetical protein [Symploca sp. SIO1C2]NER52437.1 hypothetical protein [Symploca sp. SIO1A3]NER99386.1 hypothetical protein [Symploca sp. SIO1B1]